MFLIMNFQKYLGTRIRETTETQRGGERERERERQGQKLKKDKEGKTLQHMLTLI
jgi:hypothetical protein